MECAVCGKGMHSAYRAYVGNVVSEEIYVCYECQYEEHFAYGAHKVVVGGREFVCGDTTTIAGNLTAWQVWYAILEQKEALRNES